MEKFKLFENYNSDFGYLNVIFIFKNGTKSIPFGFRCPPININTQEIDSDIFRKLWSMFEEIKDIFNEHIEDVYYIDDIINFDYNPSNIVHTTVLELQQTPEIMFNIPIVDFDVLYIPANIEYKMVPLD